MEYTATNVEAAVTQFYQVNNLFQAQAHQWLVAAQTSPQAWSFVWELLDPSKAPEVQFYAATSLTFKVSKCWHEVPRDEFSMLRTKLLETIVMGCSGHRVVLNRLCIALASCALHMMPTEWVDPVNDLLTTLMPANAPNVPAEQLTSVLLEILTVLPEEFQTMHLVQGKRGVVRFELQRVCPQVLQLVQRWLSSDTPQQAVTCARAWIQLGVPLTETEPLSDLLLSVAERRGQQDSQLLESVLDCLTQLGTHPESGKFPATLLRMVGRWLPLHDLAHKMASDGDSEVLACVYRLLISVAETHSRLLLHSLLDAATRDNSHQLIRAVLACNATPGHFPVHESCSEMGFSFWYLLQDDLMNEQSESFRPLVCQLVPVYRALTEALLVKTMFPEDLEAWGSEDQERFRCYRQDVADTLIYCYNILEDSMLVLLHERLDQALARSLEDWRPLESCLHAFFAIAEAVGTEENKHLPKFFERLQEIPRQSHIRVVATALNAVGVYAEWINVHSEVLRQVVPLLVLGLVSADSAPSATMALKDLTRDCQSLMRPFADLILQASKEALGSGALRHNESVRLMYAVGKVLSTLPMENILTHLEFIVMPYVSELEALQQQQPSLAVKAVILLRLKMLSMLFATLDTRPCSDEELDVSDGSSEGPPATTRRQGEPQPVFLVLQRVLPVLERVAAAWGSDLHVMDALYSTLKCSVSTLLDDCRPLLSAILSLVVRSYKLSPQPSALDLAKQFLVMFSSEEALMQSLLSELSLVTLSLCHSSLSEHTDLVEALLVVLAQVLKKAPRLLLAPQLDLVMLFQCGTLALGLPEGPTVKAAISFLSGFVAHSRDMEALHLVVNSHGYALLEKILSCIGGESSRVLAENMADLLLVLNKKYFDNQTRWLHQLLAREDGFPSPRATKEQKTNFGKQVLKERANKRRMQDIVRDFSLACRGMLGTEYGSQVSPYF